MNLPNFLQSGDFNKLRDMMGAPLAGVFQRREVYVPIDLPIRDKLIDKGIDVEFDEIEVLPDGTLSYKGHRVILYIRDISNHGERSALPKYHLTYCRTLSYMRQNNRFSRYVVANRDDGLFSVNWINEGRKTVDAKLDICQNCLDGIKWKGFSNEITSKERFKYVEMFSLKEFFEKYPRDLISVRPDHTSDTAPLNDYPSNWPSISESTKASRGYKCEECQLTLTMRDSRFLHVHHENGQKNDCRQSNLRVLCIGCHAEEPLHNHVKRTPQYKEFQRKYSR